MRVQEAGWYEVRTAAGEPLPSHTDYATGTLSLQVTYRLCYHLQVTYRHTDTAYRSHTDTQTHTD